MRNRIKRTVAVLLVSIGIVAVAGTPAQASWAWVLNGYMGMATEVDGNGSRMSDNAPIGACQPTPWNDDISSVINRTSTNITFWWGAGCNGNVQTYGPGATVNDVGWWNNNEWSSYCIGPFNHTVPDASNSCHRWQHLP